MGSGLGTVDRRRTERWRALEPYLDRALDLEGDERVLWLASLRAEDGAIAAEIEALLDKRQALDEERFLEHAPFARPNPSLVGQVLGAYRLASRIGQGGMGTVWLGQRCDGRFRGEAAVKILNAGFVGREGESRLRSEGSILARLHHPHIARLLDAGVSPSGQPFLVLEYVKGERIDHHCDSHALGVEARIRLFLDVLAAVSHAHANLVVHRDLKPSNVMVGADGQVKLLDFGIAKLLERDPADTRSAATRGGESLLTPAYAAPEQLTGGDVTTATDVYALGALLYVLLAGTHPTCNGGTVSPAELVRAIVDTEPGRLSEAAPEGAEASTELAARRGSTPRRLRAALRGDLENIVARALKKRPSERYASVDALAEDLRRYLASEPVSARPDSIRYRAGRFVRRHRLGVAAAALLVLSLAGGMGATAWQATRAKRAAARAQAVSEFVVGLFDLSSQSRPQSDRVTARELLDQGVRRLDSDLADQPDLQASLLGVMGRVHSSLGFYDTAAELLERSHVLMKERRPGDDPERARVLSDLSSTRRSQGDYARAAALARESLEMQRRARGSEPVDIARTIDRLASALSSQGRRAEAEPLYREALDMRRRLHGDAHREVVESLNNVATLLFDGGDYAAAEANYREALRIARSLPGDSYPAVPFSMANLATCLGKRGRPAEAEALLRESLRLWQERLGDEHPELAPFLRSLAATLRVQGKREEATRLIERTLAIERRTYGETHHEVAKTTNDLAGILHEQGRLGEAEARYRECLSILEKLLPPEHPHVGRALTGLARVRSDQGHHADAEAMYRRALAILQAAFGADHDLTAAAQAGLARALLAQNRDLAEAQALLERSAAVYRAKLGAKDARTAEVALSLAECLDARGRTDVARTMARDALPLLARAHGDDDRRTRRAHELAGI